MSYPGQDDSGRSRTIRPKIDDYRKEMGIIRQRTRMVEGILHRIEDRTKEWREQGMLHKSEAAAQRERLWAEAPEREKLLAEAVAEKIHRDSVEEVARRHRAVFVIHSGEVSRALEAFTAEKACLKQVVRGRGDYGEAGMKGSWLMFDRPE
jgi:hypothetical protein